MSQNLKKYKKRIVCSVINCRQHREAKRWPEPLSFHEIPADLARREKWLQVERLLVCNLTFIKAFINVCFVFVRLWEGSTGGQETKREYVLFISYLMIIASLVRIRTCSYLSNQIIIIM